jgi:hypothetical protein
MSPGKQDRRQDMTYGSIGQARYHEPHSPDWMQELPKMARRRRRKEDGLLAQALSSDWQFSAVLAGGCAFFALVVIPALFGHSPIFGALAAMLSPLIWLLAGVFTLIAVFRYCRSGSMLKLVSRAEPYCRPRGFLAQIIAKDQSRAGKVGE